ncbi:MAG: ATP-grasp domain-containing protein [Bacteroidota bacterium]|nr:ATP-grasp domain-containing protein [Bacteroidota bacterium]
MIKILLVGANDRATISVAKQLKQYGFVIDVADWQEFYVKHSRHFNSYHKLYDIELNAERFINELISLIKVEHYEFVIPINDAAIEVLILIKNTVKEFTKIIGLPSDECYIFSHNKYELIKKCNELNIPTPDTIYIDKIDDLALTKGRIKYPVIIKPIYSKLIKNNRLYSFVVKQAKSETQLYDYVNELIENVPLMIQEYIDGTGGGFNFLSKDGILISYYEHRRINEPLGGGQSSYRKTIPGKFSLLKEYSEKLINAVKWDGIGMIEYKINSHDQYIMEINGRFWGSIELGIFGGIDIPSNLIELKYFNKEIFYTDVKEVFVRNFKMDFRFQLIKSIKEKSLKSFFKWLLSLKNIFRKNEIVEDSFCRDFFMETMFYISLLKKILFYLHTLISFHIKIKHRKPEISQYHNIAFLCVGNICRSPFAELYAKKKYGNIYNFTSYGLINQNNRKSPEFAIMVANDNGIDLKDHKSKYLTPEIIKNIDIIFIMDFKVYYEFMKKYPQYIKKIYLLNNKKVINDPYNKSYEYFSEIYNEIMDSIGNVFNGI